MSEVSGCRWYNPFSWCNSCCRDHEYEAERQPFAKKGESTPDSQRSHSPVHIQRSPSDKGTPTRYYQADVIANGCGTPPE